METLQQEIVKGPFFTKDMRDDTLSEGAAKLHEQSRKFNRLASNISSNTGPAPMGSADTDYRQQCDSVRKSDLAKITELEKQLEECLSDKPGFVQKVKEAGRSLGRSFKNRFSQNGGKRKKTRRRNHKKTRRNRKKTRRNRKTRRHKR